MSKKDLQEFINSFNKLPGEYTREELYRIGLEHKKLDNRDKSWAALAEVVGWSGTAESYRCFVNKYKAKHEEPALPEAEEKDYETAMRNLYIERTKVRDISNSYRKDMRNEARIERLMEEIKEAAGMLPSLPHVSVPESDYYSETEAVLPFADLHLGPDFKNSYNEYSYDIAVKRVNKLVADTIKYCTLHNVQVLHFLNMGDLVSGIIHDTIRLEQTLDITEQIMKAAELVAEAVNALREAAPVVTYRSVVDNHSRAIADKNQHIERENFCRIIDWFVRERLKDTDVVFCNDNIDFGIGKFKLHSGKLVMFAHGHQDKKTSVVQDFIGATREFVDYIILAHYHSSAEKTFQGTKVFISGSIIGTDAYAYGKRLFSEPEQKLLIFDEENVLDYDINLKNA